MTTAEDRRRNLLSAHHTSPTSLYFGEIRDMKRRMKCNNAYFRRSNFPISRSTASGREDVVSFLIPYRIFLVVCFFFAVASSNLFAAAFPTLSVEEVRVPVGKLFSFSAPSAENVNPELFPSWCRLNQSNGEIYGIPQASDLGSHLIVANGKKRIDVKVVDTETRPCPGEETSLWVEVIDDRLLTQMSPPDQYLALKALHEILTDNGITSVHIGDWRLFPYRWLPHYWNITKLITDSIDGYINANQATFILHLSCGELNNFAGDVINALVEAEQSLQVVGGVLNVKPSVVNKIDDEDADFFDLDLRTIAPIVAAVLIVILLIALGFFFAQKWNTSRKLSKKETKKLNVSDESDAMLSSSAPSPGTGTTKSNNSETK